VTNRVREFYDRSYEDVSGFNTYENIYGFLRRHVLSKLDPGPGTRILDLGAGLGPCSLEAARRGAEVVALEISPIAANAIRNKAREQNLTDRLEVQVGAAESIDLPDHSIHTVFSCNMLMHVDRDQVFAEVKRLLRPGGTYVLIEPLKYNPLAWLVRNTISSFRSTRPDYLSLAELRERARGFERFSHEEFYLVAPFLYGWSKRAVMETWLGRLETALMRRLQWLRRFALVTVGWLEKGP
jgi:ubiquinone/menaquinone biosynthesis C-methylase UbiE